MAPGDQKLSWRQYSLIGAGLMTGKVLLLSLLLVVVDPTLRNYEVLKRVAIIACGLGIPGAIGGLVYALGVRIGLRYYARWILSAEAIALFVLLEFAAVRAVMFQQQEAGGERVAFFIATNPIGWATLGVMAAIAGLAYGKALAD
jgi:hypothetical protein